MSLKFCKRGEVLSSYTLHNRTVVVSTATDRKDRSQAGLCAVFGGRYRLIIEYLSKLSNMNLKLLPSDNFTICTEDSISVVRQKLMEHVENPQMIRSLNNCNFKGVVSDYKFEIRPIYKYNFHAPIVIGKFESFPNETLINLRITLRFHQYFFIVILFYQLIFIFKILIESYLHVIQLELCGKHCIGQI